MNYFRTLLLLFFCLKLSTGLSQILPPTLDCIRGDTLYWTPENNNCGPFVSTDVFFSPNPAGPYSLLASISDPGATSFHHPAMGDAYYFLQSNYNCPGQTPIPSDTINNLPPAITTLEKVSVQSDGVLVSWYDNMDQKTVAYIIYRSTDQGTLPIDTVFGGLEYLDRSAMAGQKTETYYVLAMDQCGNTGFFDMPHKTVHLTTKVNFCEQYIELNWNNYSGWQNGTESVQIWLGLDGAPLAFEHQVQLTDTLAYVTGIDDNREYCIAISAKENGRDVRSFSNMVCAISDVITPVDQLKIRNVSVNQNGDIDILWNHSSNADIKVLQVLKAGQNEPFVLLQDYSSQRPNSDDVNTTDTDTDVQNQVYEYQIESTDECDETVTSNNFSSILLEVQSDMPEQNDIEWTPFQASGRVLIGYQLCRINESGMSVTLYETEDGPLNFTEIIDPTEGSNSCYVVKAIHTDINSADTLESRSNLACIEPQIGLYIPNAFVPGGVNSIFRPVPTFDNSLINYRMQIFNRWGGLVFESEDINHGWDGRQNGSMLDPGVFFYLVTFEQPGGKTEMRTGTIHLIR
ncbi:MAG: gliding motility-associated C-terminal domain-containing protein [Saprospiraceae bacterium]|nr:gliding motility-associated C-terminal domain-containing protein [Saprospiraceae bacterium]